jgi:hypothetical protein
METKEDTAIYPVIVRDQYDLMSYFEPEPGKWWKWDKAYDEKGNLKRMVITSYYGYYNEVIK